MEEKKFNEPISSNASNDKSSDDVVQPNSGCSKVEAEEARGAGGHTEEHGPPHMPDMKNQSKDADRQFTHQNVPPSVGVDYLKQIDGRLARIDGTEQQLFSEIREIHRLYHGEFAGRLKSMQEELEQYRKIDKGRAFDDILRAVARIYSNNDTLADEVEEPRAKKSIRYLLLDMEELLGIYGISKLRSVPGDRRNPRHCQILERIPTDDPTKHDTVAKSHNTGFYIGNRTVIKEIIDIYFYDESTATVPVETEAEAEKEEKENEENQTTETGGSPVSE